MGVDRAQLADTFEGLRPELTAYLTRMVVRSDVAQELTQTTAVHALEHLSSAPEEPAALRRWLFRIATNLAIDERRRHGRWRESVMGDVREWAKANARFQERLQARAGGPELQTIAR